MGTASLNEAQRQLQQAFEQQHKSTIKDWDLLAKKFRYREMGALEHWINAGDYCVELCVILEGLLRAYYIDQAGNEVNQHFYQANEVFAPISAIISNEPCQYYIQVLEPVKLMLADYNELHEVASENPDWLRLEIKMLQTVFLKNAKHEAQLLMGNGEQRFKWFRKEYPELLERLPQYHVASFLGITPVSLSRLRKKIEGAS
ncbi:MAG: Crp/Fnr family transcriptional regulator [Pseudomonadales bacterium]|nr:Crp/Fnr family transcriptional regulator [Pseudomonadales bacterium]